MKKRLSIVVLVGCLLAEGGNAAQIDLQAGDASDQVTIDGEGDIFLVIKTSPVDTIGIAFVQAFLDADNELADVEEVTGGQDWVYDHSSFRLPAELSQDGGNEYALNTGDDVGRDTLPPGSGVHIIDILTLSGPASGSTLVTFETGARNPQVFGPAPTYTPFQIAPPGFPPNFPNILYLGDESSNNTPFEINYIPEPAALALWAIGGWVVLGRR